MRCFQTSISFFRARLHSACTFLLFFILAQAQGRCQHLDAFILCVCASLNKVLVSTGDQNVFLILSSNGA